MVVKTKRKSINSSGVWEVEDKSQPDEIENEALDATPQAENQKPGNVTDETSPSKPKKKKFDGESSPKKVKQLNEPQKNLVQLPVNGAENQEKTVNYFDSWTSVELLNLVLRIEENCKHILSENYHSAVEKVDWSKVSFGERSAEECEKMWLKLFSKARTNRELVEEIRAMLLGKELLSVQNEENTESKSPNTTSTEEKGSNAEEEESDVDEQEEENNEKDNAESGSEEEEEEEDEDDDDDEEDESDE